MSSLWEHDLKLLESRYVQSPSEVSAPLHDTASITMGRVKIGERPFPFMVCTPVASKDNSK